MISQPRRPAFRLWVDLSRSLPLLTALVALVLVGCRHTPETVAGDSSPSEAATATTEPVERGVLTADSPQRESFPENRPVRYRFDLSQGDLVDLTAQQLGIDVVLELFDPSGTSQAVVDGQLETLGDEPLLWVTRDPGLHTLVLTPATRETASSTVVLRLETPRAASDFDRRRAEAASRTYEALALGFADGEAPRRFEALLETWDELGETAWQRRALNALAASHLHRGDVAASTIAYERLLTLRDLEPVRRASTHRALGYLARRGNDPERALRELRQALESWDDVEGGERGRARILNDLGAHYARLREGTRARELFDRALISWRAQGDTVEEGRALNNRGRVFLAQSRFDLARSDLELALALWEAEGQAPRLAVVLDGLGQVAQGERRSDDALGLFERALALRDDPRGRAVSLLGLGDAAIDLQQPERAREALEEARVLFRGIPDVRGEAEALRVLGRLQDTAQPDQAEHSYRESLRLARRVGDLDGEAASHLGLARAAQASGRFDRALEHLATALDRIEIQRHSLSSLDARSTYFASRQSFYDFGIALRMFLDRRHPEGGHAAAAFDLAERARARSLLELLEASGIAPDTPNPELASRERHLEEKIALVQLQLERQLRRDPAASVTPLKDTLQRLLAQLREVRTVARAQDPMYAAVTQSGPSSLDAIQQALGPGTTLLEYRLAEPQSWVWVVRHDRLEALPLAKASTLETLAREASSFLGLPATAVAHRQEAERTRQRLSEALVGPIDLDPGDRLLVVAEGALQRIPFAALSDRRGQPLVERHAISYLPSASLLPVLRQRARPPRPHRGAVAVLANPVFTVPSSPAAGTPGPTHGPEATTTVALATQRGAPETRRPLLHTQAEAEAIALLAAGEQPFVALGPEATKDRLFADDLGAYRILHIATHAEVDLDYPDLSRLAFSVVDPQGRPRPDSDLLTHEVYDLELNNRLVVLSACQTYGAGIGSGDGLAGWTQGFLYSGAQQVMVSLWNVNDASTAALMKQFYTHHLQGGVAPTEALRRAQVAVRQVPQWSQPLHWAGFVLVGDPERSTSLH